MTQKIFNNFINEIYSKPPKKNYSTSKTDVHHIDGIWSLDILNIKDHGPENNRGYRYVLVVIDIFNTFAGAAPLKNENAQTKKNSFEKILINLKENQIYSKVIEERNF